MLATVGACNIIDTTNTGSLLLNLNVILLDVGERSHVL